jgi:ankyrin repeat protein
LLHIAAEFGAVHCATVLLDAGADLEALTQGGDTPLLLAIGMGRTTAAALFLERGARLNYQWTPEDTPSIRTALRSSHEQSLCDSEQYLKERTGVEVDSALHEKMLQQLIDITLRIHDKHPLDICHDFETLRLLVEDYGCDPNRHDGAGYWPLKSFAEQRDAKAIAFLLQRGAKVDFTSTGETALHAAVGANSIECAELLLNAGANPNQQDVDGWVPLCRAASVEMLGLLIRFNADPNIADQCGLKPSHWIKDSATKARLAALERSSR